MNKCFFLTGTDTSIGKTVSSCAILQAATNKGYSTIGYKPVSSGDNNVFCNTFDSDVKLLRKYSSIKLEYNDINPFSFPQSTSPHIASKITGKIIDCKKMSIGLEKIKKKANWIIIEGAGGWFTLLTSEKTFADWVLEEQLPVILTVGIKTGCINHAILTAQAIKQSGLILVGWIANSIVLNYKYHMNYLLTLQQQLNIPCLGIIPYLRGTDFELIGKYINLDQILQ